MQQVPSCDDFGGVLQFQHRSPLGPSNPPPPPTPEHEQTASLMATGRYDARRAGHTAREPCQADGGLARGGLGDGQEVVCQGGSPSRSILETK